MRPSGRHRHKIHNGSWGRASSDTSRNRPQTAHRRIHQQNSEWAACGAVAWSVAGMKTISAQKPTKAPSTHA